MQDQRLVMNESANKGRLFGRLQPYPNQVLKCPRCESLNTKFCYYNNYNLSQPRHFCKSCRRYWTKDGVLRNVPVGGGCRKPKRSNPKSASTSSDEHQKRPRLSNSSHSSSDSSTLTPPTTEPACSTSLPSLLSFPDSRLFMNHNTPNPPNLESSFNLDQCSDNCGAFGNNGTFTGLMNAGTAYDFTEISPFRLNYQRQQHENELQHQGSDAQEMKMEELTDGCNIDQTVGVDLSRLGNGKGGGELTTSDWQSSQGLFDLTQGFWSQSQWTDPHHHIYLP